MLKRSVLFLALFLFSFSSCSVSSKDEYIGFLNFEYRLWHVGQIFNDDPNGGVRIDWMEGTIMHNELFDFKNSILNFQCVGTSYENFHCEATLSVFDKDGNVVFEEKDFWCEYNDGQSGEIVFLDSSVKNRVGNIYYNIFRTRWFYEYVIDGNPVLLTFEFKDVKMNELPSFLGE